MIALTTAAWRFALIRAQVLKGRATAHPGQQASKRMANRARFQISGPPDASEAYGIPVSLPERLA